MVTAREILMGMLKLETAASAWHDGLTYAERAAYARANPRSPYAETAGWFDQMSSEKQKEYVEQHPHSRYAKGGKSVQEWHHQERLAQPA